MSIADPPFLSAIDTETATFWYPFFCGASFE